VIDVRNRKVVSATCLLLALSGRLLPGAEPRQIELSWNELGPRLADHKVTTVLPGGTRIEGKVMQVEPDGLRLKVTKTSDRAVLRKGERLIPRQSVSVLRVTEYRKLGRLLVPTAAVGISAGVVAANYPNIYVGGAVVAFPAVIAGGLTGLAIGGYYAGKRIDRRITEIHVRER
jgi:hypothetical protein